jgi:hypothetical protein
MQKIIIVMFIKLGKYRCKKKVKLEGKEMNKRLINVQILIKIHINQIKLLVSRF